MSQLTINFLFYFFHVLKFDLPLVKFTVSYNVISSRLFKITVTTTAIYLVSSQTIVTILLIVSLPTTRRKETSLPINLNYSFGLHKTPSSDNNS